MTNYTPSSLLPKSYEEELHALDIANAKWIENIRLEAQKIETLANPMLCPIEYLPFLADAFGVEFYYEEQLDEEAKRLLVQNSLLLHSKKGTKWALKRVLELLGVEADIVEWFEEGEPLVDALYSKAPYTFYIRVNVSNLFLNMSNSLDATLQKKLLKYIDMYKNVRSEFELLYHIPTVPNLATVPLGSVTNIDLITGQSNPKEEAMNEMAIVTKINVMEVING